MIKSWLISIGLVIGSIILASVTVEYGYRVAAFLFKGPLEGRIEVIDHPELGWVLNARRQTETKVNRCDEEVVREPPPGPYLVKMPRYENATRILFLGDSFTHASAVSTGAAYYDVFEELNKDRYSVYAAGVGGYGNFQELLLLEKIYAEIQPDLIVIQLSNNDVINNVFELERASVDNNNGRMRPYLIPESGEIIYEDPNYLPISNSRSIRFLFGRLLRLDATYDLGILARIRDFLQLKADAAPRLMDQGLAVLGEVLDRAKAKYPNTRFIGFSVGGDYQVGWPVYGDLDAEFRRVFEAKGAAYIPEFAARVTANHGRVNCMPLDPHWNHHGHRIAGQLLSVLLNAMVVGP